MKEFFYCTYVDMDKCIEDIGAVIDEERPIIFDTSIFHSPIFGGNWKLKDIRESIMRGFESELESHLTDYPSYLQYVFNNFDNVWIVPEIFDELNDYNRVIKWTLDSEIRWMASCNHVLDKSAIKDINMRKQYHRKLVNVLRDHKRIIGNTIDTIFENEKIMGDYKGLNKYDTLFNVVRKGREFLEEPVPESCTDEHIITNAVYASNVYSKEFDILTEDLHISRLLDRAHHRIKAKFNVNVKRRKMVMDSQKNFPIVTHKYNNHSRVYIV